MKIALFGGSFDPVHSEHIALVEAAKAALSLDKVFIIPARVSPFKLSGAAASDADRLEMCRIAFAHLPYAEVSDLEIVGGGTSYSYLTCRNFRERFPSDELYFLMGADSLEGFLRWKNPEEIVRCVTLAACDRGEERAKTFAERIKAQFGYEVRLIPFRGQSVSSTRLRVELAFGQNPPEICEGVKRYISEHGLYTHPAIVPALSLEKEERVAHSFRVALMAAQRAESVCVPQGKAILAAALHDCGKYVPLSSPLLLGFHAPQNVPAPVMHQYTGAYLAERLFGVTEEDVLDAVRYHTSGRENMSAIEKLIYLADMLESERTFEGVEELRNLYSKDLDECLRRALEMQISYLRQSGKPVYPLTEKAYEYLCK